ncbi:hypothetical protein [Pedobacter sp.]|uniref:hypothetical protein n=1 Tax=Pedobacter sp. TaxID=1411316 RepID=UPI003BABFA08
MWGYTAVSSIFYFLDQLGYEFFEHVAFPNVFEIEATSLSQKFIVFAHACYLSGYFVYKNKNINITEYRVNIKEGAYLKLSIGATILALLALKTPFSQLSSYLNIFSTICAVKYFGYSLSHRKLIIKGFLYFTTVLLIGFLSGMKESTLFPLIYLGVILYDKYGVKRTSLVFFPLILAYFYFIPTLNGTIREAAWYNNKNAYETLSSLDNSLLLNKEKIRSVNWAFLSTRLSEISMLNRYLESVPARRPYYNLEIYKNGVLSLIPRIIWPSKLSPDITAQQRAIENGALIVNSPYDTTSAKPQTVADAYMSYGYLTVFITFLCYGFLVHTLSHLLEKKLGYDLGLSVLFYSLFSILSRGGCFENLFNTTFYGFVLIFITIHIFKKLNYIEKNPIYLN